MGKQLYVLYESASGYSLFEVVESGDLAALKTEVQNSVTDLARFSKIVKLKAFQVSIHGVRRERVAFARAGGMPRAPARTHCML